MIEDEKKQKINTIHEKIDSGRYRSSNYLEDIDYLIDNALVKHKVTSYTKKVGKKYSTHRRRVYRGKRKIRNITNRKLPVKEIIAIALALFIILAAIPYILPPLYGDFGTDVTLSLDPDGIRLNETLFVNVTIPSSYNITQVNADMAGIETIDLSLFDNSTSLHLWQAVWVVRDAEPGEHIVTITALDVDNKSYSAGVGWSVLPEEILDDNQSSEPGTNETVPPADDVNKSSNETIIPVGLNLSLSSDKLVYVVNEPVSVSGFVRFNNSLINTSVNLLIIGPGYNSSLSLNSSDGRFDYQFAPNVVGSYTVQVNVSYMNETVQDAVVFDVQPVAPPGITPQVSELSIWDDTDYQVRYIGDQVTFYANYSSNNLIIENASCLISFNIGGWTESATMNYSDGLYVYKRSFDTDGFFEYRVSCSAQEYYSKSMVSECAVSIMESVVFELESQIEVGKPVLWKQTFKDAINLTVNISKYAYNISVSGITSEDDVVVIENSIGKNLQAFNIDKRKHVLAKGVNRWLSRVKSNPDNAQSAQELYRLYNEFIGGVTFEEITDVTYEIIEQEIAQFITEDYEIQLLISNISNEVEITYLTEGPEIEEEQIGRGKKRITVSSDIHYENVSASTELPMEAPPESVKLYHIVNGSRHEVSINKFDLNDNSLIDYIEWVVPSLSNQTYELIIEISEAAHLDENREFISDIYDEVKAKDDIWSEPIYDGEYVRVTFESLLDNSNDITIYVRNNQGLNTIVEVYYVNSTDKITEFPVIEETKYYKVLLTSMAGSHNIFDLRVRNLDNNENAYLEFDHIIDPTPKATGFNVYRDSFEFTSALGTSYDVEIGETIDTDHAFLVMYMAGESGANLPSEGATSGYILNTTHIRFERNTAVDGLYISWFVIECFNDEFTVRARDSITLGTAETSDTGSVSGVTDMSQCSVHSNFRSDGDAATEWDAATSRVNLTAIDTVTAYRFITDTQTTVVRYEVVEWDSDFNVYNGTFTMSAITDTDLISGSGNPSDPAITLARSILFATWDQPNQGLQCAGLAYWISDTNELTFRHADVSYAKDVSWYLIEFPASKAPTIQRWDYYWSPTVAAPEQNNSMTEVNVSRTFIIFGSSVDGTGTAYMRAYNLPRITDSTHWTETQYNPSDAVYDDHNTSASIIELPYGTIYSPTITTNSSTGVEETNATLHGYLENNGTVDTTCYFILNDTNDFGSPIFNLSMGVTANNSEFSNDTAGEATLTHGTLYYYIARANNSVGWDESGGVQTFLTKPDPPSSLTAQTNSSSVIYLTWSTGTGHNTTYIERNASGDTVWARGSGTMIYNGSGANYEDTSLAEGVTYYYQAWSYTNWTYNSTTLDQWSDDNASANIATNNRPTQSDESPTNQSTNISTAPPDLYVVCSDSDAADTLNATWWSNSSGNWVQFGSNNTGFTSGTNITQTNSNFSDYNETYWWSVNVSDGEGDWSNETYHFTTGLIDTSVDTISPYNVTSSPKALTATGSSDYDNVTLWYRWSDDNSSWGHSGETEQNTPTIDSFVETDMIAETTEFTSDSWSHTCGNYDDDVLVVCFGYENNDATTTVISTVEYGTDSLTKACSYLADEGANDALADIWYLLNPPTGTNTVYVNFSSTIRGGWGGSISIYNVKQVAPIVNGSIDIGTPSSVSTDMTTIVDNSIIIDCVAEGYDRGGMTAGTGQTEFFDADGSAFSCNAGGSYEIRTTAGTETITQSWGADGYRCAHAIVAFEPTNTTWGNGSNWAEWVDVSNPDSDYASGGWNWTFDFPNSTGYYEFYSIGNKSGSPNETAPVGADAICNYVPPTVPTVTTNASTGIEETNATLNGWLQDNGGVDTTCGFRFGTSSGTYSENFTKGIYPSDTEFSNNNGSLTQGQIYYYQAWANNSVGFANGTEMTFLTKPDPPTSLIAQTNSTSVIYLTWSTGTGYNTTYIERNASGETAWARGDGTMIYNNSGTNYEDTGLLDGTTYYYQAWSYTNWSYNPTLDQWSDNNASASNTTIDIPRITLINPSPNGTTGISTQPTCQIWANDTAGHSLNVTWAHNISGSYVNQYTNISETANSTVSYQFLDFTNYSETYYWKVYVHDSGHNESKWYYFTTELIDTSVDTISPYIITYSPVSITATGPDDLGNVTLWYRYSSDNLSWDDNVSWNDASNPDDAYPWSWEFDFDNGSGYYEFYSIGNKTGSPNETIPVSKDALCRLDMTFNNPPTQSNEVPNNQSTGISCTPQLNVTVDDGDLDTVNATWWSNSSGSWVQFGENLSIDTSSGEVNIIQTNSNFSDYGTTYWWSVNLTDGEGGWTNATYYFTTESIATSVDTISPYNLLTNPHNITATGSSDYDNVTLWYRWSDDNNSWGHSGETTYNTSTYDDDASEPDNAAATSMSWTHVVGSGLNNSILIVCANLEDDDAGDNYFVASADFNGDALTRAVRVAADEGFTAISEIWYLLSPDAGSHTVTVNFSVAINNAVGGSASFSNVNQSMPDNISNSLDTGDPTSLATGIDTPAPNSLIVAVATDCNSGNTFSYGSEQSEIYNEDGSTHHGVGSYRVPSVAGNYTMYANLSAATNRMSQAVATWAPSSTVWGNGSNWAEWSNVDNPDDDYASGGWNWSFDFPNSTGYYEFYSIGNKSGSPNESAPVSADTICLLVNTSIEVTPASWDIGTTTVGNYNYSTSGFYFNLTNNGTASLNIQINASNATNATTGSVWNLTSTPGHDNYSLLYNLSSSWININQTYDTFITDLAVGSWQTFDLNIFMATTATKDDPLTLTVTFRSVVS